MKIKNVFASALVSGVLYFASSSSLMAETLTKSLVSSWLESQPKVEAFGDKHDGELSQYNANMKDQASPAMAYKQGIIGLKASNLYSEFDDIVDDFGFSSPEQWADVGGQIMNAFMALEMEAQGPEMAQAMQQMQSMMQSADMKNLPPAQREMMMQSMKQGMNMYQSSQDVPQHDKDVVRPFLPKLRAMGER